MGKSLVYQALPYFTQLMKTVQSEAEKGSSCTCCVVVNSPLVELMEDQQKSLASKNIASICLGQDKDNTVPRNDCSSTIEVSLF